MKANQNKTLGWTLCRGFSPHAEQKASTREGGGCVDRPCSSRPMSSAPSLPLFQCLLGAFCSPVKGQGLMPALGVLGL